VKRSLALLALAAAVGCGARGAVDERKLAIVEDEIATLGSAAKTPGPRTPVHVARITSDVEALKKNVRELVR
jgi:hypothetical protein